MQSSPRDRDMLREAWLHLGPCAHMVSFFKWQKLQGFKKGSKQPGICKKEICQSTALLLLAFAKKPISRLIKDNNLAKRCESQHINYDNCSLFNW